MAFNNLQGFQPNKCPLSLNGQRQLMKNPEGSVKIEQGDYLVMMMDGKGESKLQKFFHIAEGL